MIILSSAFKLELITKYPKYCYYRIKTDKSTTYLKCMRMSSSSEVVE